MRFNIIMPLYPFLPSGLLPSHIEIKICMCISCRPRVLTCRARLILPGLITTFIEYGE